MIIKKLLFSITGLCLILCLSTSWAEDKPQTPKEEKSSSPQPKTKEAVLKEVQKPKAKPAEQPKAPAKKDGEVEKKKEEAPQTKEEALKEVTKEAEKSADEEEIDDCEEYGICDKKTDQKKGSKTEKKSEPKSKADSDTSSKKEPVKEEVKSKLDSAAAKKAAPPKPAKSDSGVVKKDMVPKEPKENKPAASDSLKKDTAVQKETKAPAADSAKKDTAAPKDTKASPVDSSKKDSALTKTTGTKKTKSDSVVSDSTKADSTKSEPAPSDSIKMDTTKTDSAKADSVSNDSLKSDSIKTDSLPKDTAKPESLLKQKKPTEETKKKREKLFYSSRINTIDDMKGRYKSPKKALFMSMVIPGLGQAYVGGTGNWIRGGAYVVIEGMLAFYWHYFVVTKFDRQVKKYQSWADSLWSMQRFESEVSVQISGLSTAETRKTAFPHKEAYCAALFGATDPSTSFDGFTCVEMEDTTDIQKRYEDLQRFQLAQSDTGTTSEKRAFRDSTIRDKSQFYELIGKYDEFITGWEGAQSGTHYTFAETYSSADSEKLSVRDSYRKMRKKATDYSRMQSIFLGGIILNHIVSAVDAALAAKFHNKKLYQTDDVSWYDRIKLESNVGVDRGYLPFTYIKAKIPF